MLARSLAEHNPDTRLRTLIIDDFSRHIDPSEEPFEVLTPADIGCGQFTRMALRYSVLELSTAVKPWLLRHLMEETDEPVTYLDPDIKVYGELGELDRLATRHGVVLIPHNSEPIPPDGRMPSQVDIMIAGVYNLGYVSLAPRPEVERLIDWWADRLLRDCRVDPVWGYFVDQRWFDLAPGFLTDLAIVRDPEFDVAYWNLHSRDLRYDGGRYVVDDRPLAFFHFSGFDPEHPLVLSRHQDRIDVAGDSVLERLLAEYAADLMDQGYGESHGWPYSYAALADGTQMDDTLRGLFDTYVEEHNGANGGVPSPFTLEGVHAFERWLTERAPGAPPGINRVLARVYEDRADLRATYPALAGSHREGLLGWAEEFGTREVPLLARVGTAAVEPVGRERATGARQPAVTSTATGGMASLREDPWGVNVVGYFRSELGTGEAARQVVNALDAKEVPALPIHGQTVPLSRQGHPYVTAAPEDAPYPVNVICMNADMLPEFASQVGDAFFAGRYSIGLWFWEVSRFPERWTRSFSLLEEVWAPTAHVAAALEPLAEVPVSTVRIPVQPALAEPRSRAELGLPEDGFQFLFSFDYLSVFKRKNPLAVIDAFGRAFAPGEGARLALKCINGERDPDAHAQLLAAAASHPDIEVIDSYFSPADNVSLTAACDCYVSLHRSEGFGLVMAEAMWLGKPVIATGYSGNLDFMTSSNSLLVDYRLAPIGAGADPYPPDGEWADPDVEHAAGLMRQVFDDREGAGELGATAAREIRRTHSAEAAGEIMLRRLESIRGSGRPRRAAGARRRDSVAMSALPTLVRRGPTPVARAGRGRALRERLRNLALRAMRPFSVYQQKVNSELIAAIDELNERVAEVGRAAADDRARVLSELRRLQGRQRGDGPAD